MAEALSILSRYNHIIAHIKQIEEQREVLEENIDKYSHTRESMEPLFLADCLLRDDEDALQLHRLRLRMEELITKEAEIPFPASLSGNGDEKTSVAARTSKTRGVQRPAMRGAARSGAIAGGRGGVNNGTSAGAWASRGANRGGGSNPSRGGPVSGASRAQMVGRGTIRSEETRRPAGDLHSMGRVSVEAARAYAPPSAAPRSQMPLYRIAPAHSQQHSWALRNGTSCGNVGGRHLQHPIAPSVPFYQAQKLPGAVQPSGPIVSAIPTTSIPTTTTIATITADLATNPPSLRAAEAFPHLPIPRSQKHQSSYSDSSATPSIAPFSLQQPSSSANPQPIPQPTVPPAYRDQQTSPIFFDEPPRPVDVQHVLDEDHSPPSNNPLSSNYSPGLPGLNFLISSLVDSNAQSDITPAADVPTRIIPMATSISSIAPFVPSFPGLSSIRALRVADAPVGPKPPPQPSDALFAAEWATRELTASLRSAAAERKGVASDLPRPPPAPSMFGNISPGTVTELVESALADLVRSSRGTLRATPSKLEPYEPLTMPDTSPPSPPCPPSPIQKITRSTQRTPLLHEHESTQTQATQNSPPMHTTHPLSKLPTPSPHIPSRAAEVIEPSSPSPHPSPQPPAPLTRAPSRTAEATEFSFTSPNHRTPNFCLEILLRVDAGAAHVNIPANIPSVPARLVHAPALDTTPHLPSPPSPTLSALPAAPPPSSPPVPNVQPIAKLPSPIPMPVSVPLSVPVPVRFVDASVSPIPSMPPDATPLLESEMSEGQLHFRPPPPAAKASTRSAGEITGVTTLTSNSERLSPATSVSSGLLDDGYHADLQAFGEDEDGASAGMLDTDFSEGQVPGHVHRHAIGGRERGFNSPVQTLSEGQVASRGDVSPGEVERGFVDEAAWHSSSPDPLVFS